MGGGGFQIIADGFQPSDAAAATIMSGSPLPRK
jgi:hypothetical protein